MSIGNVNFEAAVSGVPVLINNCVTGGEILEAMGYRVFYYETFCETEIKARIEVIESILDFDEKVPEYDNEKLKRFISE